MDEAQETQQESTRTLVEAASPPFDAGPLEELATAPLPAAVPRADDDLPAARATPAIPVVSALPAPHPATNRLAARLVAPLSPWVAAFLAVGAFTLLGLVYSAVELFTGADWADGARTAAFAAFGLAVVCAVVAGGRYALGRRAVTVIALAALLTITLAGTGVGALTFSSQLHRLQARSLEQSGRYEGAIHEYELAGDTPPTAPDTARAYNEWAESLLAQRRYADALSRFILVSTTYQKSGAGVARAEAGIFHAYSAWVASGSLEVPYPDAIAYFQGYLNMPACDSACQSSVKESLARASYQYGLQLTQEGRYADAITQLGTVQSQHPQSSYAAQAHRAAATAYLDLGQQQLTSTCGSAIKTYKTLVKSYADTPEGQQAKKALAAPQSVTGKISGFLKNPAPTVYLSRSASPIAFYFSNDYHAALDSSSGTFAFNNIPQGTYYLDAVRDSSGGTSTKYWFAHDGSLFTVHVGPLCPVTLGTFPYAG
jgi:tetratricopeptide (TPR) repeat protein